MHTLEITDLDVTFHFISIHLDMLEGRPSTKQNESKLLTKHEYIVIYNKAIMKNPITDEKTKAMHTMTTIYTRPHKGFFA